MNAMVVVAAVSLMTAMACLDGPRIAALRGAGPPSAAGVDPPIAAGQAQGLRGWLAAHITTGRLRVGLLAAAVVWLLLGQRVTGLVAGAAAMPASMVLLGWAEAEPQRRRCRLLVAQLPGCLDLLSAALDAGVPLRAAVRQVAALYGVRPGVLGTLSLLRRTAVSATMVGAMK